MFDDAKSVNHADAILPEANITTSVVLGIWQGPVDIVWKRALITPVVYLSLACDGVTGACHMSSFLGAERSELMLLVSLADIDFAALAFTSFPALSLYFHLTSKQGNHPQSNFISIR